MHNKYSWLIRWLYQLHQIVKPEWDSHTKATSHYSFSQIGVNPVNRVDFLDAIRCSKAHSNYEEQNVYVVEGLI